MKEVTDSNILSQLENQGENSLPNNAKEVTDPNIISKLESNLQSTANQHSQPQQSPFADMGIPAPGQFLLDTATAAAPVYAKSAANLIPNILNPISKLITGQGSNLSERLATGRGVFPKVTLQPPQIIPEGIAKSTGTLGGETLPWALASITGAEPLKAIPYIGSAIEGAGKFATDLGKMGKLGKIGQYGVQALGKGAYGSMYQQAMQGDQSTPLSIALGGLTNVVAEPVAKAVGNSLSFMFGKSPALKNTILDVLSSSAKKGVSLTPEEAAQNLAENYTDIAGNPMTTDIETIANDPTLRKVYEVMRYIPGSGISTKMNQLEGQLLDKSISTVNGQIEQHNAANTYLNSLAEGLGDRTKINKISADATRGALQNEKNIAAENWAPVNNSDFRFDIATRGNSNPFPNYSKAAYELLAQRQNLTNLFGSSSDLGGALNSEISKAENSLKGMEKWGYSLPDLKIRMSNIGGLAAAAARNGDRNSSRLLMGLYNGLKTDAHNILNESGEGALASQWQKASEHSRDNIYPFYEDPTINKVVSDKTYIPVADKLAKSLHNPNNDIVAGKLPNEVKNAQLYKLITSGKETSAGIASNDAKDIASKYMQLPGETKQSIASYNPHADQYFENLSQYLAPEKGIDKLAKQLEQLKNAKFGTNVEGGAMGKAIPSALKSATLMGILGHISTLTLAAPLLTRKLGSILSDPELIKSYISGTRFPQSTTSKLLTNVLPALAAGTLSSLLGGQ